jgi:hypothetical protein
MVLHIFIVIIVKSFLSLIFFYVCKKFQFNYYFWLNLLAMKVQPGKAMLDQDPVRCQALKVMAHDSHLTSLLRENIKVLLHDWEQKILTMIE